MAFQQFTILTSRFKRIMHALLGVFFFLHAQLSHSQVVEITAEMYRAVCERWLPTILEHPGPKWIAYEATQSDRVLDAVMIDGLAIPHVPLDGFQAFESTTPRPKEIMYQNSDVTAIQIFGQWFSGNSPVYGQEFVDAGLIDGPLTYFDLERRAFGLNPSDLSCTEELSDASPRKLFNRYVELSIQLAASFLGKEVIAVNNTRDYVIVDRGFNSLTLFRFTTSNEIYNYKYASEHEQDFESFLNAYIWSLENEQYRIVENVTIEAMYQHAMTPREEEEDMRRNERFMELLRSVPRNDEDN